MSVARSLQEKFRGAMVGAVIGDCVGFPLEYWKTGYTGELSYQDVVKHFNKCSNLPGDLRNPPLDYTDDTAMSRQLAASMIYCRRIDHVDLARRFTEEYYADSKTRIRGYGANVTSVFHALWDQESYSDPLGPAKLQFNGSGSYGNGAAMRVHPVSLYFYGKGLDELREAAKQSSLVTHTHKDGYNGAILLAAAVSMALEDKPTTEMMDALVDLAQSFGEYDVYYEKMKVIRDVVREKKDDPKPNLGNGEPALDSVPTAIYSFLRGLDKVEGLDNACTFTRILQLAISFGGDTDTIGTMAAAMAGAKLGDKAIPGWMKLKCDGIDYALMLGDKLHEIVSARE